MMVGTILFTIETTHALTLQPKFTQSEMRERDFSEKERGSVELK